MPNLDRWRGAVEDAQKAGQTVRWIFDEGLRDEAVAQAKQQFGGNEPFPAGSIVSLT